MLTAKYFDTGEIIDITKYKDPRNQIEKSRLRCKFCESEISVKQGLNRAKHFFHLSACTSDYKRHPESAEHNIGKELIANHIKIYWQEFSDTTIEYEYPIPEIKRIADIAMIFPNGWIVVHEIQLASITNEELQKRTEGYNRAGIDAFWWLGNRADSPENRKWCIEKYGYSLSIDYEILQAKVADLQI